MVPAATTPTATVTAQASPASQRGLEGSGSLKSFAGLEQASDTLQGDNGSVAGSEGGITPRGDHVDYSSATSGTGGVSTTARGDHVDYSSVTSGTGGVSPTGGGGGGGVGVGVGVSVGGGGVVEGVGGGNGVDAGGGDGDGGSLADDAPFNSATYSTEQSLTSPVSAAAASPRPGMPTWESSATGVVARVGAGAGIGAAARAGAGSKVDGDADAKAEKELEYDSGLLPPAERGISTLQRALSRKEESIRRLDAVKADTRARLAALKAQTEARRAARMAGAAAAKNAASAASAAAVDAADAATAASETATAASETATAAVSVSAKRIAAVKKLAPKAPVQSREGSEDSGGSHSRRSSAADPERHFSQLSADLAVHSRRTSAEIEQQLYHAKLSETTAHVLRLSAETAAAAAAVSGKSTTPKKRSQRPTSSSRSMGGGLDALPDQDDVALDDEPSPGQLFRGKAFFKGGKSSGSLPPLSPPSTAGMSSSYGDGDYATPPPAHPPQQPPRPGWETAAKALGETVHGAELSEDSWKLDQQGAAAAVTAGGGNNRHEGRPGMPVKNEGGLGITAPSPSVGRDPSLGITSPRASPPPASFTPSPPSYADVIGLEESGGKATDEAASGAAGGAVGLAHGTGSCRSVRGGIPPPLPPRPGVACPSPNDDVAVEARPTSAGDRKESSRVRRSGSKSGEKSSGERRSKSKSGSIGGDKSSSDKRDVGSSRSSSRSSSKSSSRSRNGSHRSSSKTGDDVGALAAAEERASQAVSANQSAGGKDNGGGGGKGGGTIQVGEKFAGSGKSAAGSDAVAATGVDGGGHRTVTKDGGQGGDGDDEVQEGWDEVALLGPQARDEVCGFRCSCWCPMV